jgi:hypothetical protein
MSLWKRLTITLLVSLCRKMRPFVREADLPPDVQKMRIEQWKAADRNDALWNEVSRLKESAELAIIRRTKVDAEVAFHRGGLVYLETLRKNVSQKALRIRKQEMSRLR